MYLQTITVLNKCLSSVILHLICHYYQNCILSEAKNKKQQHVITNSTIGHPDL